MAGWGRPLHRVISMSLLLFRACSLHGVFAYQTKLDSTAIEEAYVVGQRNDKTT